MDAVSQGTEQGAGWRGGAGGGDGASSVEGGVHVSPLPPPPPASSFHPSRQPVLPISSYPSRNSPHTEEQMHLFVYTSVAYDI